MTRNQIFEAIAYLIVNKNNERYVWDYDGAHFLVLGFSHDGKPFENEAVCGWSLQDALGREHDAGWCYSYDELIDFLFQKYPNPKFY